MDIVAHCTQCKQAQYLGLSLSIILFSPQVNVPTCTWNVLQPLTIWAKAPSNRSLLVQRHFDPLPKIP
jgi:hypothetical protein